MAILGEKSRQRVSAKIRYGILACLVFASISLRSQEASSLRGTIRDSQGQPLGDVTVCLQAKEESQAQVVHSDSHGTYSFAAVPAGTYTLRASMAGYTDAQIPSIFFSSKEVKTLDLILLSAKESASQTKSDGKPAFFDEPRFAIAGVTDTTGLGGHGSDTVVRTRETIAKEAVSLGNTPTTPEPRVAAEAEKSLRDAVQQAPDSYDANHSLGKMLVENGKAREAIPYLERAGSLKPADYENAYDLALANERAGNHERARAGAQTLLAHGDQAEVHHLLGDVLEKLGNPLEAVREYQRAAELDPREAYIFDWGSELLLHHAADPALEVFTKGNQRFPRSERMLIGLGAAWFARGSNEQAVQRICEASDLNPGDPAPYLFLGKIQSVQSAPSDQVVERMRRFAAQKPQNAQANHYYAASLWKLQKVSPDPARAAQIESLLQNALRLDPKLSAAYLQLGILYSDHKDYRMAITAYQHAIQTDPHSEEAHYRLAQAYRLNGDATKAEQEVRIYDQVAKEQAQNEERERHEIRQFVYTLRDQPPAQAP